MQARFDRQSFLGETSDDTLAELHVGIVGLGGGGSHIAQQLAHIGVGYFVLFDSDRMEESNLNRLVGATLQDVRKKEWKVKIASRVIRGVSPDADVQLQKSRWQQGAQFLRECDVIFGGVDSFAGRDELERFARRYLVPYIDIGMDVHQGIGDYALTGQVALSMPGEPCLRCMNVLRDDLLAEEAARYGAAGSRPQVIWPNAILASMAVGMMVQLVTPWHKHAPPALLEYDGNAQEVRVSSSIEFLRTKVCHHFLSADDLGDSWYENRVSL